MSKQVTIAQIRVALHDNDYAGLREIHGQAKAAGIEHCDEYKLSTLNLCILECSLFKGASQGHTRTLVAMLDAIERGNHPYDDAQASATMHADAAIAQAQLDAIVGRRQS